MEPRSPDPEFIQPMLSYCELCCRLAFAFKLLPAVPDCFVGNSCISNLESALGIAERVVMGTSRRSVGLLRSALALQAGRGGQCVPCTRRTLASVSDSEFAGVAVMGDRNVDIFDRALKSKQVPYGVSNLISFSFAVILIGFGMVDFLFLFVGILGCLGFVNWKFERVSGF